MILTKKPPWLRKRLPNGGEYEKIRSLIKKEHLHTVCQEARCPNIFECFSKNTATFLIMGSKCTRNCRFCSIDMAAEFPLQPPDPQEPTRIAETAKSMNLNYVVITSVTRDDLQDGGADCFACTIKEIKNKRPGTLVEVLVPDFQGDENALKIVLNAGPNVLNHNIETVKRLYSRVRPQAVYERSLNLLRQAKAYSPELPIKSGLMLGLGEQADEIEEAFQDLYNSECRILTLGQYLQPTEKHLAVKRFVPPQEFDAWGERALQIGFLRVASGPLVRSSYRAQDLYYLGQD
ncbi:Lipoyl synthase [Candidatus Magnetomoraceae bacterium gMMP-1]